MWNGVAERAMSCREEVARYDDVTAFSVHQAAVHLTFPYSCALQPCSMLLTSPMWALLHQSACLLCSKVPSLRYAVSSCCCCCSMCGESQVCTVTRATKMR